ncbi:MAG TPA: ComEA family DNA-binding protein [Candidatus Cybelea sp.]|jgi:competence protein ComEA|nr:ComEA family DNA-binding protein [Candidatus Cybelea sp.]
MFVKYALIAAAIVLAAVLIWHPARRPVVEQAAAAASAFPVASTFPDASAGRPRRHRGRFEASDGEVVVYLAGAVKRPGLYHLHFGDRNAQAVGLAGGLSPAADASAVNLAQRANDGDEIDVPILGEAPHSRSSERHARRRSVHAPPASSVDVNRSDASQLAVVPGIGHAIAERIVELRQREGSFASLDELLDVAGMTQTRLERARPYLRRP